MKTLLITLLFSLNAQAIELTFTGPCSEEFIMRTQVEEEFENVGELTASTLTKFSIPFLGSAEGIASVFGTPVGNAAMEIISPTEMRAYGWCFAVDGVSPDLYSHEVIITRETQKIAWIFGFAHFKNGQWITQCTPAYKIKPTSMCEDPTTEVSL
jgi:hypothetical protein